MSDEITRAREEQREVELRMDAYYYGFDSTGSRAVDRVLSAVACAGKAFHSTEDWTSPCEPYHAEMTGSSCREWIQNAAVAAAAELAAESNLVSALQEQLAAEKLAHLETMRERDEALADLQTSERRLGEMYALKGGAP